MADWWGWVYGAIALSVARYAQRCRHVVIGWVGVLLAWDWAASNIVYELAPSELVHQFLASIKFVCMFVALIWGTDDDAFPVRAVAGLYSIAFLAHLAAPIMPIENLGLLLGNLTFAALIIVVWVSTNRDLVGEDRVFEYPWWQNGR